MADQAKPSDSDIVSAPTLAIMGPGMESREVPGGSLLAGRYEVISRLGAGGMGTVYLASDQLVGDRVAVKVLSLGADARSEALELFKREVRLARRVTHANVVRIHDLIEQGGQLFISMEYVQGSDLRAVLHASPDRLGHKKVARLGALAAAALGAAHAVDVVHRDLKPENILVDHQGRVLLGDFGIARAQDGGSSAEHRTIGLIGTPAYMSPEQVAGEEVGPATDLFALGVLLFELATGKLPFEGNTAMAVAIARLQGRAPDPRHVAPDVPEAMARVINACLEPKPEHRPASAESIEAELRAFAGEGAQNTLTPVSRVSGLAVAKPMPALSTVVRRRSLACLPFVVRGGPEHAYLGDAVAAELIDVLSRTKGLRILSHSATSGLGERRRARDLCPELDVDYIVDGSLQIAGERMRIVVRLVDASDTQLASEKFEVGIEDLFAAEERAARCVAEALRLELTTAPLRDSVPQEAMESYLRARKALRVQLVVDALEVYDSLDRAIEQAPHFSHAYAARALVAIAAWFFPHTARLRDWAMLAEKAVREAEEHASDLPETYIASGRLHSQHGNLRGAVVALRRALSIAPTSPVALSLLGQLEAETGKIEQGLAKLTLASDLEPSAGAVHYERARAASLRGEHDTFRREFEILKVLTPGIPAIHQALRHALWWHDQDLLAEIAAEADALAQPAPLLLQAVQAVMSGETPGSMQRPMFDAFIESSNRRFGALLRQILIELCAVSKEDDAVLDLLEEADRDVLFDLSWLDACPLLAHLRDNRRFRAVRMNVNKRCIELWAP